MLSPSPPWSRLTRACEKASQTRPAVSSSGRGRHRRWGALIARVGAFLLVAALTLTAEAAWTAAPAHSISRRHKTPAIKNWFARHPRFHVHFTPASASWLNQVEHWFATLTQCVVVMHTPALCRYAMGELTASAMNFPLSLSDLLNGGQRTLVRDEQRRPKLCENDLLTEPTSSCGIMQRPLRCRAFAANCRHHFYDRLIDDSLPRIRSSRSFLSFAEISISAEQNRHRASPAGYGRI